MVEKKHRRQRRALEQTTQSAPPLIRDWNRLDPLTRIDRIELGRVPDDLDGTREMTRAVAERFSQRILTNRSPVRLAQSVQFLTADEYMRLEIAESLAVGYTPTLEDIEHYKTKLATTPKGSKGIYVNHDLVTSFGLAYPTHFPEAGARLSGRDLLLFMLKSILFHEFGHVVQSEETFPIQDYTVTFNNDILVLNRYEGTYFTGYLASTPERMFVVNGSGEASTEAVARYASKGAGEYYGEALRTEGAKLIEQLNTLSQTDGPAYARFHTGVRRIWELFGRWSRISMPDNKDTVQGRNCLIFIGLAVDQHTSFENVANMINQQLVVR